MGTGVLRWRRRQDRQGSKRRWGELWIGKTSSETETDERKWTVYVMLKMVM